MGGIQCQEQKTDLDKSVKLSSIDVEDNSMLQFMLNTIYNDNVYGNQLSVHDNVIHQPNLADIPCPTALLHVTPRLAKFDCEIPYTQDEQNALLDEDRFDELEQLGVGRFNSAGYMYDSLSKTYVVVKEGHKATIRGKYMGSEEIRVEEDKDACLLCHPYQFLSLIPPNIASLLYAPQKPSMSTFTRSAGDTNQHLYQDIVAIQRQHDIDLLLYQWYHTILAKAGLTHCADTCTLTEYPLALQGMVCLYFRACLSRISSTNEILENEEYIRTVSTFRGCVSGKWEETTDKWKLALSLIAMTDFKKKLTTTTITLNHHTAPPQVTETQILQEYVHRLVQNTSTLAKEKDTKDDVLYVPSAVSDDVLYLLATNALQCLSGLSIAGIAHRDIKPQNVCADNVYGLSLIDFSEAKLSSIDSNRSSSKLFGLEILADDSAGTSAFLAPELCDEVYNHEQDHFDLVKQDIYAFGVQLYIYTTNYLPYHAYHKQTVQPKWIAHTYFQQPNLNTYKKDKQTYLTNLEDCISTTEKPIFPENASPLAYDNMVFQEIAHATLSWPKECLISLEARDFIASMMEKDVDKRATIEQLMAHPFITSHMK